MQYNYDFHLYYRLVDASQMLGEIEDFITTGMSTMCLGMGSSTSSLVFI